jgi:hypothetical protein
MAKVRVGVIGAGSWAIASHLPNLAKHDELEYVGISRKGPEILKKISDRYGFQVASEDYRDVLNAGVFDATAVLWLGRPPLGRGDGLWDGRLADSMRELQKMHGRFWTA